MKMMMIRFNQQSMSKKLNKKTISKCCFLLPIYRPATDDDRRESIVLIPCEFCHVPQPSGTLERHQVCK